MAGRRTARRSPIVSCGSEQRLDGSRHSPLRLALDRLARQLGIDLAIEFDPDPPVADPGHLPRYGVDAAQRDDHFLARKADVVMVGHHTDRGEVANPHRNDAFFRLALPADGRREEKAVARCRPPTAGANVTSASYWIDVGHVRISCTAGSPAPQRGAQPRPSRKMVEIALTRARQSSRETRS